MFSCQMETRNTSWMRLFICYIPYCHLCGFACWLPFSLFCRRNQLRSTVIALMIQVVVTMYNLPHIYADALLRCRVDVNIWLVHFPSLPKHLKVFARKSTHIFQYSCKGDRSSALTALFEQMNFCRRIGWSNCKPSPIVTLHGNCVIVQCRLIFLVLAVTLCKTESDLTIYLVLPSVYLVNTYAVADVSWQCIVIRF